MLAERWCEGTNCNYSLKDSLESEDIYCESAAAITGDFKKAESLEEKLKKAVEEGNPEEAFENAPLNGGLSVVTMARTKAGFDPTNIDDKDSSDKFSQYRTNLQRALFFHFVLADVSHMEHNGKSWDNVIDNVLDLYDGVSSKDKESIRKSLGNIAKAAMNKAGTTQTKNLFIQSEIIILN